MPTKYNTTNENLYYMQLTRCEDMIEKEQIRQSFENFISTQYDEEESFQIWAEKSKQFQDFWTNRILNKNGTPLSEGEIDEIIRILDRNAKGNTKVDNAVAKVMIAQGAWRRMFNQIKNEPDLHRTLNEIFTSEGDQFIRAVNTLYKINEKNKNNLTGKRANAINAMLFVFNPKKYLSVVSLKHRKLIIDYFGFVGGPDFEADSPGQKIFQSNRVIIEGFKSLGIETDPRAISSFLYSYAINDKWRGNADETAPSQNEEIASASETSDSSTFAMEKELEDFLIANWDKTELSKEFELIEEDGEMVSQQYQTDIGTIDILVRDRKSKQYAIIELKKSRSSDATVGQLLRYIGWVETNKSSGQPARGVIIASTYDEKLEYALKPLKKLDIRVYQYEINFKLREFKKSK